MRIPINTCIFILIPTKTKENIEKIESVDNILSLGEINVL